MEATKFRAQYPGIKLEVRRTREFHDRFLVLDESKCYHLGASIKNAGNPVFMITVLEDADNVRALMAQQAQSWNGGLIVIG